MTYHENIFEGKKAELQKQHETLQAIDSNIVTLKGQLAILELNKEKQLMKIFEIEKSLEFMTGLLSALNDAFDREVESAKQSGFEDGYKTKAQELKNSKKPVSTAAAVRKKRVQKKKK